MRARPQASARPRPSSRGHPPPMFQETAIMRTRLRTVLIAAACALVGLGGINALAQSAAPTPNTPRLRALDWKPFDAALLGFATEKAAAIDALTARATIPELQAAMQGTALSAEDLTLYFLSRLRRHDERLRTCLELNPEALNEARASDVAAQGRPAEGGLGRHAAQPERQHRDRSTDAHDGRRRDPARPHGGARMPPSSRSCVHAGR
jgi:hypothetical protein